MNAEQSTRVDRFGLGSLSYSGPGVRLSALPCVKQSLQEEIGALLFLF